MKNLKLLTLLTTTSLVALLSACVLPPPARTGAPAQSPPAATAPASTPDTDPAAEPVTVSAVTAIPLYKNLGEHTRKITTRSPETQQYFNQGLILTYAFNHGEALRMFKEAARFDPTCAMCYWGIAYVLGPNYNAAMDAAAVPEAYAAVQKAGDLAHESKVTDVEHALIHALGMRYSEKPVENRAPLDKAYADAMREVAKQFPDDADVQTLFAESLMDLMPWNLWTKEGKPTENTQEILTTLETALKLDINNPGANHFYVHATEPSPTPELAVPVAERLATLVPDAGHLVHMPGHTYYRVGRYHDAVEANIHAAHADESHNFTPDRIGINNYSVGYYPHNIHFLFAAALMEGNRKIALEAAHKLAATIPVEAYKVLPQFELFPPSTLFTQVQFGLWDDILKEAQPPAQLKYTTGIWHYARGMAFVRKGNLSEAQKEQTQLNALATSDEMAKLGLLSFATAGQLLTLANGTLEAEIAGAQGDTAGQIKFLEASVKLQDALPYIEPPSWYFPIRQALGAVLLKAHRAADAEAVYREDLRQYPKNGWSLFGQLQSLKAQGKDTAVVQKQFDEAWQYADVTLTASQY